MKQNNQINIKKAQQQKILKEQMLSFLGKHSGACYSSELASQII